MCILITLKARFFFRSRIWKAERVLMQFPGTFFHWLTFLTLLWLIPSSLGQYDICYFKNNEETCHHGTFDPPLLSLPDNICSSSSCGNLEDCQLCSDCSVVNWVTFAQHKNKLYDPSHLLSKSLNRPGNDTAYDCTRSQDAYSRQPCSCPTSTTCSGDDAFCRRFSCDGSSPCFCHTETLQIVSYLPVDQDSGFDALSFVSYKACIFNALPPQTHKTRNILSIESAEFSNDDVHIHFHNPVFTFSRPGTFIARKDGLEVVSAIIPENLQLILPNDFRYSEGSLTFTFVTSSGTPITGAVHVPSSTHCDRINCIFCMAMIKNFSCLPPTLQYIIYSFIVFLSGLSLIYIRAALRSIISIGKSISMIFAIVYRLIRSSFRLSLRLGTVTGTSTRHKLQQTFKNISDFANYEPRIPQIEAVPTPKSSTSKISYSIVLLLVFLPVMLCSSNNEECNSISIINSRISECEVLPSGEETCTISGQAQATLTTIGSSTCIFFTDDSSQNVFFVRIAFTSIRCQWTTIHQYYTYPVSVHVSSSLVCPNFDYCSWGAHCSPGRSHFPGITKEAKSWPGSHSCISTTAKSRFCAVIHYDPCLHYRWYLIPKYNTTYRVDKITGHTCRPSITISEAIQNRFVNTTVVDQTVTQSGIQVNVLGTFDQPITLPSPYLVQNIHDQKDSHIESASPKSQPTPGQLGDIQTAEPLSTNFVFNPLMVDCNNYQTTVRCHIPQSYINILQQQRPNILPRAVHNHHFYLSSDGTLESTLLRSAPVVIHLRFQNMRISVKHTKICPRIESIVSVTGCHSCQLAAKIILKAQSLCSSGQASVSFNDIPLSTRSVHLSTDVSEVTIHFITSNPCHEERLCLFYNELKSCEPLTFCLDAPAISLTQRNVSSAQSTALIQSSGIFDSFISSTQSLGNTLRTGLYTLIACLAAIFIFALLMTLLKR